MSQDKIKLTLSAEKEAELKTKADERKQVAEDAAGSEEERRAAKSAAIAEHKKKKKFAIVIVPKGDAEAVRTALIEAEQQRIAKIREEQEKKK